ncbi:MAG: DUF4129 domain-containing protein [Rhodobacteraceae bacterium]|nr:DUF4129 domain-containing protein [Paracoccaceae bacterium]
MRVRFLVRACLLWLLLVTGSVAQEAPLDGIELRESGEAYAASIRFRGINTSVGYFDPTRPPPPLETDETLRQQPDVDGDRVFEAAGNVRATVIIICAAILLFLTYIIVSYGGRFGVSFARDPEDGSSDSISVRRVAKRNAAEPVGLEAILRMPDKREALVALCKSLLARSVAAQGVLFQRSWTDRDALRRVPAEMPHRDALRALVLASERVQFGGRDVTETEFRDHLESVRPLWTGAGASS